MSGCRGWQKFIKAQVMIYKKIVDTILYLANKLYHRSYFCQFQKIGRNVSIGRRVSIEYPEFVRLGDNVQIGEGSWFSIAKLNFQRKSPVRQHAPDLTIGANTYIGRYCVIACIERVHIGESVLIADRCFLGDAAHGYENPHLPVIDQYLESAGAVTVGNECWLGIGVVVLPGVTIGKHCVIGAGAVVTTDIPDYSVAVGNPARIVRKLQAV